MNYFLCTLVFFHFVKVFMNVNCLIVSECVYLFQLLICLRYLCVFNLNIGLCFSVDECLYVVTCVYLNICACFENCRMLLSSGLFDNVACE